MAGNNTNTGIESQTIYVTFTSAPLGKAIAERQRAVHATINPSELSEEQVRQLLIAAQKQLGRRGHVGR
jgi:F0F1-type ATP synthase membrane subunit b/b'